MSKPKDERFFRYVRDYLTVYLPKSRNCSPNTVKSYREAINLLRIFMATERQTPFTKLCFELFDRNTVYEFLEWLERERNCGISSRNQRLAALKSFFNYAASCDPALCALYMDIQQIRALRDRKPRIPYFSQAALKAILAQPNTEKRTELRNRFLMILLYDTGARIQELLDLRLRDISLDFDTPLVYLTGKGNKTRATPLTQKTVMHLKEYLKEFHDGHDLDEHLFFTVIHGRKHPMSSDTVSAFLKRYADTARNTCPDIPAKVQPHMFRHSRAMHLYQSGIPLSYIKDFLGHASVTTTNIYASADISMIKSALEKVASLSQFMAETPSWEGDEDMILKLCGLK